MVNHQLHELFAINIDDEIQVTQSTVPTDRDVPTLC